MNVLLVGNGAREHVIAEALARSRPTPNIFAWMKKTRNPGIAALVDRITVSNNYNPLGILDFAKKSSVNLAIIGPEEPLFHGVADAMEDAGIRTVGPRQKPAQLETSKSFTRELMKKYHIPGSPKFKIFKTMNGLEKYLNENMPVVLKPDGLTGGKGVMVQGEHFDTIAEALKICREILKEHRAVVVEKKLLGEEFSLQCFVSGMDVKTMPPVQDHKRRFMYDQGPNTGGMGSYSCANHLLPFLTPNGLAQATEIMRLTVKALTLETGQRYKGVIYGNFMVTADGIKLIEFNARFADPEAMNVLPIMETDFLTVCQAIVDDQLDQLDVKFKSLATVVKYVVPVNYGLPEDQHHAVKSDIIRIDDIGQAKLYYAGVYSDKTGLHLTSSRALAVLGVSPDLYEAEIIADRAADNITGAVDYRTDIGKIAALMEKIEKQCGDIWKN
ncbi:MAG: phosphoribosylamine--glycine ligase [Parcubacteria group bacterium]|nr:phosphoribosylamine--glycine ligase [Parcubacteria group bacterium]